MLKAPVVPEDGRPRPIGWAAAAVSIFRKWPFFRVSSIYRRTVAFTAKDHKPKIVPLDVPQTGGRLGFELASTVGPAADSEGGSFFLTFAASGGRVRPRIRKVEVFCTPLGPGLSNAALGPSLGRSSRAPLHHKVFML